jgi:hypothetical protein
MKALVVLAALIGVVWGFPRFWYTKTDTAAVTQWLQVRTNIAHWKFRDIAVDKSAERLLVADRLHNGEFIPVSTNRRPGLPVRVFAAWRLKEDPREIGLFVHTPDRCWVQSGWSIESTAPEIVQTPVHGRDLAFERRIFQFHGQRELVYFTGLVGGQTLPYRLDHNLSVSRRVVAAGAQDKDRVQKANRWNDSLLWQRVMESFASRRPLLGPKQFLRISTPLDDGDLAAADRRIREFLPLWLEPEQSAPTP